jgi:hypothetical protein
MMKKILPIAASMIMMFVGSAEAAKLTFDDVVKSCYEQEYSTQAGTDDCIVAGQNKVIAEQESTERAKQQFMNGLGQLINGLPSVSSRTTNININGHKTRCVTVVVGNSGTVKCK